MFDHFGTLYIKGLNTRSIQLSPALHSIKRPVIFTWNNHHLSHTSAIYILLRKSPFSVQIGKYGLGKTRIRTLFRQCYKNYPKFCTRKCKEQYYVYCDHNGTSMIYINSNMALLRVRNHKIIVYNNVLGDRARLTHHPSIDAIDYFS